MGLFSPSVAQSVLLLSAAAHTVLASAIAPITVRDTAAGVFDGQYLHPSTSNSAVEWWWAQAIAEPVGNNPPAAFQLLFYQGYPFQVGPRDPSLPEFYIDIKGFFPNGTQFGFVIPASSGDVTAVGQKVTGKWGDVGGFVGAPDLSTWTATFTAASFGVEGTVKFRSNAKNHFGCNSTTDPYFTSAVPAGKNLTAAEKVLFTQLGWATAVPGGSAIVDIKIKGTKLKFYGLGYHDANWSPQPLNDIIKTWFFGSAQFGDTNIAYVSATPSGSNNTLLAAFVSIGDKVIEHSCKIKRTNGPNHVIITPYGLQHDSTGVDVMTGFLIDYLPPNGDHFRFNLTSVNGAQNPDEIVYHRWVATGSGGKVGEKPKHGLGVFEWLNPGLVPYVPSINPGYV